MASLSSMTCTPPRPDRQHQTSQEGPRSRAPGPSCPPGPSTPSGASGSSGAPSQSSAASVHQILYELSLLKGENAKQSASLAKLRSQQSKLQSTLDELALKSFSIEKSPLRYMDTFYMLPYKLVTMRAFVSLHVIGFFA